MIQPSPIIKNAILSEQKREFLGENLSKVTVGGSGRLPDSGRRVTCATVSLRKARFVVSNLVVALILK